MTNVETLRKNLEANGFQTSFFATAQEAADYLDSRIDGVSVAFGGSITVKELDLYPRLSTHNKALWHWEGDSTADAALTDVYITSVNAAAETGELINIDGGCNRVASSLFGHKKVYFVIGVNKIAPDYEQALWRARNIAAPKNAQRLGRKTPCAAKADKCYNCHSPERICNALVVHWRKPLGPTEFEVVIINQELGY